MSAPYLRLVASPRAATTLFALLFWERWAAYWYVLLQDRTIRVDASYLPSGWLSPPSGQIIGLFFATNRISGQRRRDFQHRLWLLAACLWPKPGSVDTIGAHGCRCGNTTPGRFDIQTRTV
jgi:hypothetical protein